MAAMQAFIQFNQTSPGADPLDSSGANEQDWTGFAFAVDRLHECCIPQCLYHDSPVVCSADMVSQLPSAIETPLAEITVIIGRWHCVGGSKLAWQRVSGLANSRAAEQNGLGLNVYDDGGASNWHCHPSVCAVQLLLLLSYCNSTCLYIRVAEGRQKYHQYPIFNIICRQPCPRIMSTLNPAIYPLKCFGKAKVSQSPA